VRSTVEHRAALFAYQVQPTCGFSALAVNASRRRHARECVAPWMTVAALPCRWPAPSRGDGEELDLKADRPERAHLVGDLGRDRLGGTGPDLDFQGWLGRHGETEAPLVHHDPPPRARGEAVRSAQPRRHRLFVPLGAGTDKTETVGRFRPVTQRAGEPRPDPRLASGFIVHPSPELERGAVTDMLAVAARKLGDPVSFAVLVVAGDRSFHRGQPMPGLLAHTTVASIRAQPCSAPRAGPARRSDGAAVRSAGRSPAQANPWPGTASDATGGEEGRFVGRSLAGMLLTVGHGTLEIEELTGLLVDAGISCLVDVRSFPGSRRLPHFGREMLASSVPAAGVRYEWRPALGGRRKPQPGSVNVAWRNLSFQAYADYMTSAAFLDSLDQLVVDATEDDVAVMCSESLWWRCHRRLIADASVLLRHREVWHLFHDGRLQAHPPTPEARVDPSGVLVYDVGTTPRLPS